MPKIRITQLDGSLPNIALMKLSHWHKAQGDDVYFSKSWERELFEPKYDIVYGSAIFQWTKPKLERFLQEFPQAIIGGTGTKSIMTIEDITGGPYEYFDYSKCSLYAAYPNPSGRCAGPGLPTLLPNPFTCGNAHWPIEESGNSRYT